jgi:glutaconate CoA-transferase subunit B
MEKYATDYTISELVVTTAAREIKNGYMVIVGIGYPLFACLLAKYTHAPKSILVLETGAIDFMPKEPGMDVADPRMWYKSTYFTSLTIALGATLHRGLADLGMIGAAQVDKYGNVNSTVIGPYERPIKRLPGSGGANDIASLAKRFIIIMPHEKRRFVDHVDYITSPGYLDGFDARERAGLSGFGPSKVITGKVVFGFDEKTKQLKIESVHPGFTLDDVRSDTGIDLTIPKKVPTTEPPTIDQLKILREKIDPQKYLSKKFE